MQKKIAELEQRLFVLKNYEKVFLGNEFRQDMPECCGLRFDLNLLLRSQTRTVEVDVNGTPFILLEVTCPECGNPIPPTWQLRSSKSINRATGTDGLSGAASPA